MIQRHAETKQLLQQAAATYEKWYNKSRIDKAFVEGDWVMLSAKNIQQRRPSNKLADKYLGPFQITRVVGDHKLAYELDLPKRYRIHNVFPISLLEPYHSRGDPAQERRDIDLDDGPRWEVEAILGHRGPKRHRQYLIRWKGYSADDDSWEPRSHIDDGPLLQEYEHKHWHTGVSPTRKQDKGI